MTEMSPPGIRNTQRGPQKTVLCQQCIRGNYYQDGEAVGRLFDEGFMHHLTAVCRAQYITCQLFVILSHGRFIETARCSARLFR